MKLDHPDLSDVALTTVMHALSDAARLQTVRTLACNDGLNCSGAMACEIMPKSTRSNHFKVLRAAGLIRTEKRGREVINTLRRDELDARFPGLLEAVL